MDDRLFTIVIPIIPKHYKYLRKLLVELNREFRIISEVLICASSVTISAERELQQIIQNSASLLSVRTLSTSEKKTAGENRNIGWDNASSEFLAFLDADDIYHPSRLTTVLGILLEKKADALVHNYYRMLPTYVFNYTDLNKIEIINHEDLLEANRERLLCPLPSENLYLGQTNLVLPDRIGKYSRVHHGHLVVRREIPIRYSSRKVGEDGELVVEILRNGFRLIYADGKLSIYDRLNLKNVQESITGRAKVILSRIYRFLFNKFLRK